MKKISLVDMLWSKLPAQNAKAYHSRHYRRQRMLQDPSASIHQKVTEPEPRPL